MKQSKVVQWYCMLAAVVLTFLLYVNYTYKNTEIDSYNWREVLPVNQGWTYAGESGSSAVVKLPLKTKLKAGETYTLTTTLPKSGEEGSVLCFKSNHLLVNAYIEDALVYSFGVDERNTIGKSPGYAYCFIPIKLDSLGKEIRIEYTAVYNSASKHITGFMFGEKTTLVTSLIRTKLVSLILCALVFFIGIVFIIVYLTRNQTMKVERSLFYLGLCAIPIAIWSAAETQILQFFIPNVYIIQYITYLSLGLIGLPFLMYFSELYHIAGTRPVKILAILSIATTMLCLLLQVFGIKDLPELTWLIHGSLLIVICYLISFISIKGIRLYQKRRLRDFVPYVPMILLMLCCFIDINRYYIKVKGDYSKYVRLGFILYIACVAVKSMMQVKELKKENEQLENLAYFDAVTGLNNYTAFKLKCIKLMESMSNSKTIGIVRVKILDLEHVEETFGEVAKEELIKTVTKLVQLTFSNYGEIYRVSEDGFAVVVETNVEDAFSLGEKNLNQRLQNCNHSRAEKIRISFELREINERMKEKFDEYVR